ncbi:hypothetical protein AAZX31_05G090400 [Glycine max]
MRCALITSSGFGCGHGRTRIPCRPTTTRLPAAVRFAGGHAADTLFAIGLAVARAECTTSRAEISPPREAAEKRKRKTRREKRKPMTTLTMQHAAWRRSQKVLAGGVQRQRSSEAVAPAVEVALLQRRELHSLSLFPSKSKIEKVEDCDGILNSNNVELL